MADKRRIKELELIATLEIVRLEGGGLAIQLEEEPSKFQEKLWRMQWNQGKHSFELYRQLRRKMVRRYKELERLRKIVTKLYNS